MGDKPWDADRPLDAGQVRASIESQFPGLDARAISFLGSGWEFDVYVTADGWCFRFPRRVEYSTLFDVEAETLGLVAPVLGPDIAVPLVELRGSPGPSFPYPFAGHRVVPGIPANDPHAPSSSKLALELGFALQRLHAVPEERASAAGLSLDGEGSAEWLEETLGDAPHLEGVSPTVDAALRWLRKVHAVPQPYAGPPRLVHNDLCPEHLLVDAHSGSLLGVIDWTDAALGDPVVDFIVPALWRGLGFVRSVLDSYVETDPDFSERLIFQCRVRSLHWLCSALEQKGGFEKHHLWVRNAFGELDSL